MKKADPILNIQHVCQLFEVPISSYYKQQEVIAVNLEKEFIISSIIAAHNENIRCYGRRRMLKSLQKEKINIGIFKVSRLMREAGGIAKIPNKSSRMELFSDCIRFRNKRNCQLCTFKNT
ncbi:MAG: hypothetical protein ACJAWS_002843 [Oleiphilaceae bacterium]|jgi:hypothetical protein